MADALTWKAILPEFDPEQLCTRRPYESLCWSVPLGILPKLHAMRGQMDVDGLAAVLPNEWIDQLAVVGSADRCLRTIEALIAAGVTSVVLVPEADSGLGAITAMLRSETAHTRWSGRHTSPPAQP